ncbi:uncharacterized protein EV422DRAFT_542227 [Fimicolochytrium jonesii]|uniref:uncharacterized protein n=1 Tax=Fimicolochytrium jonesii TaxID=1396493 RepID=UPI0022FE3B51|nr:uncharacterized protein EV422DRAFT_542227 [Fimicolochytrium jonesii]KAI8817274.1 hypothetical protein EV422DRAFT_542227 [Fimicolochytrium jonesii]
MWLSPPSLRSLAVAGSLSAKYKTYQPPSTSERTPQNANTLNLNSTHRAHTEPQTSHGEVRETEQRNKQIYTPRKNDNRIKSQRPATHPLESPERVGVQAESWYSTVYCPSFVCRIRSLMCSFRRFEQADMQRTARGWASGDGCCGSFICKKKPPLGRWFRYPPATLPSTRYRRRTAAHQDRLDAASGHPISRSYVLCCAYP